MQKCQEEPPRGSKLSLDATVSSWTFCLCNLTSLFEHAKQQVTFWLSVCGLNHLQLWRSSYNCAYKRSGLRHPSDPMDQKESGGNVAPSPHPAAWSCQHTSVVFHVCSLHVIATCGGRSAGAKETPLDQVRTRSVAFASHPDATPPFSLTLSPCVSSSWGRCWNALNLLSECELIMKS